VSIAPVELQKLNQMLRDTSTRLDTLEHASQLMTPEQKEKLARLRDDLDTAVATYIDLRLAESRAERRGR
jgi:hypothetical protein